MLYPDIQKIKEIISPVLERQGLNLFDINSSLQLNNVILRLLVDKPRGGISIDECASLNEEISNLLESQNIFETRYTLEISSPGVDRPLKTENDFLRVIGRRVRLFLSQPVKGRKEIIGIIKGVKTDSISIDLDNSQIRIPTDNIISAKQLIE